MKDFEQNLTYEQIKTVRRNVEIMKEYLKEKAEQENKKIIKTSKELIEEQESEENEEIYRYQSKITKILAMQKLYPEKVIQKATIDSLYGIEEVYLDDLISYYQE